VADPEEEGDGPSHHPRSRAHGMFGVWISHARATAGKTTLSGIMGELPGVGSDPLCGCAACAILPPEHGEMPACHLGVPYCRCFLRQLVSLVINIGACACLRCGEGMLGAACCVVVEPHYQASLSIDGNTKTCHFRKAGTATRNIPSTIGQHYGEADTTVRQLHEDNKLTLKHLEGELPAAAAAAPPGHGEGAEGGGDTD
jgi:hypothetical protein